MSLSKLLTEAKRARGLGALLADAKAARAQAPPWVAMLDRALALVQSGKAIEGDRLRQQAAKLAESDPDSELLIHWRFHERYNDVGEELQLLYDARDAERAREAYAKDGRAIIRGITLERVQHGMGLGPGEYRLLMELAPKWLGSRKRNAEVRELIRGTQREVDRVAARVLSQIETSGIALAARTYHTKLFAPRAYTDPGRIEAQRRYVVWEANRDSDVWMRDRSYYGSYLRPGSEGAFYVTSPDHVVADQGYDPNLTSLPSSGEP